MGEKNAVGASRSKQEALTRALVSGFWRLNLSFTIREDQNFPKEVNITSWKNEMSEPRGRGTSEAAVREPNVGAVQDLEMVGWDAAEG